MKTRTKKSHFLPSPVLLAIALATGVAVVASALPVDARMAPRPVQNQVVYQCEVPVEAARSVQMAYAEYYECVDPIVDEWLKGYPEQAAVLAEQYAIWKSSRDHDLRDRSEAARFVRNHPVDFTSREVSLTARQVESMGPNSSSDPAKVRGAFQRFFVDRSAERLFLSTDEEGLVSLDISQRYEFAVEGAMGSAGGMDFFVVDQKTALMEEDNEKLGARDLVVLDISDRSNPSEIHRLEGALPNVGRSSRQFRRIPNRPPTFDEYRAIREGKFAPADCGNAPTVSTHRDQRCRPDGTCYREVRRSSPTDEGHCERRTVQARPTQGRVRGGHGGGGRMRSAQSQPARSAAAPTAPEMEETLGAMGEADGAPAEAPRGGEGGAGSLSQMMVHESTLFVLSADHGLDRGWLTSFDISEVRRPRLKHLIALDNGPEALQRHDNLLLVAGRDALVTASVASNDGPRILGERRQRCPVNFDPVVVQGSIAYRTIIVDQPWSTCSSRLEVIDLSQPHQPTLRTTESIARPRGLAVMDHRLFVADESHGVRVFDITDPVSPKHATTWRLPNVKDLVLSDFDLYAMTPNRIETYYVGPLYGGQTPDEEIVGRTTVVKK